MTKRIAILGWGSLLWDKRPEFDDRHSQWALDGPDLKIEFSRISKTRSGGLTLVVDPSNGTHCRVAHAISTRRTPEDAICDLRSREGTTRSKIGIYFVDGSVIQSKDRETLDAIRAWAATKVFDVVIWKDLSSNFEKVCGHPFSVDNALAHLRALDENAKSGTVTYVSQAPAFVNTPLRTAIEAEPWFQQ